MKLSEAILLGDSLKKPASYLFLSPDGSCGCALGGAALAVGITTLLTHPCESDEFMAAFPWFTMHISAEIGVRYFKVEAGRMVIEELVDFVRSIEPAEDATSEQEKAEQLRLESIAEEREGTEIYTSGYPIL